jgi:hypothetical protein
VRVWKASSICAQNFLHCNQVLNILLVRWREKKKGGELSDANIMWGSRNPVVSGQNLPYLSQKNAFCLVQPRHVPTKLQDSLWNHAPLCLPRRNRQYVLCWLQHSRQEEESSFPKRPAGGQTIPKSDQPTTGKVVVPYETTCRQDTHAGRR